MFGTVELTNYTASDILYVYNTDEAPLIDGILDPVWEIYPTANQNVYVSDYSFEAMDSWNDCASVKVIDFCMRTDKWFQFFKGSQSHNPVFSYRQGCGRGIVLIHGDNFGVMENDVCRKL